MQANRRGLVFEPFEIIGTNFTGSVQKDKCALIGGEYSDKDDTYFLFEWDIKIGEGSIFAQLKVPYSIHNNGSKPNDDEFVELAEKATEEANSTFNDTLLLNNLFITYPREGIKLSKHDKEVVVLGILNR